MIDTDELRAAIERVTAGDLSMPPAPGHGGEDVTDAFATMVDAVRAREAELRATGARIAFASDQRRRQAERDLHSGVQQHMALLGLKLSMLRNAIRRDPAASEGICDELVADLQDALRELRSLAHGIYPVVLENEGLEAALRNASERAGIFAGFTVELPRRLPPAIEAAVYFCCAEMLGNTAHHGGSEVKASVAITESDGRVIFEVRDDGVGFDVDGSAVRSGLQHITDRVTTLDGTLRIDSTPGRGTVVHGEIPLGE